MAAGFTDLFDVTNAVEVNVVAHVYCSEIFVSDRLPDKKVWAGFYRRGTDHYQYRQQLHV